jgi:iduronate 2-sulfatase
MTSTLVRLLRIGALAAAGALAASASAAAPRNILLIVSDDLTACLGCYGNPICRTPNLDRLAQQGVLFTRAYCQNPVCGPSRASLMSGLYPEQNGITGNSYVTGSYRVATPSLANHPSMGGLLRAHGFVSMRIAKIYHMGIPFSIESGEPAGDEPESWDRAFNTLAPESASRGDIKLLSPKRTDFGTGFNRIIVPDGEEGTQADMLSTAQALAILQTRTLRRSEDKKRLLRPTEGLFLAVGFVRPHVPLVAPRRLFDHYPPEKMPLPHVPPGDLDDVPAAAAAMRNDVRYGMNEQQQREAIAAYYASVEFMDEQVGRLLAELDRLGIRNQTAVIFTSDNGYHLGEHTLWQKTTLFEESVRVPLLVSAPGFEASAGKRCDALVELVDLYPTVADLVGLSAQAPTNLAGRSLRPLLANPAQTDFREVAYSVTGNGGCSVRDASWRYNHWGDGSEELYDLVGDPRQFTNRAKDPSCAATLERMRRALAQKQASLGPRPLKRK